MDCYAVPAAHGRLHVGPLINAKSRAWLERHLITHIVNVTEDTPCLFSPDICYLRVAVRDAADANIAAHFERCHAFVSHALARGGAVLFHCHMGKSRSAALLAAFLIREEGMTIHQAMAYARSVRQSAAPNIGFVRQLRRYATQLSAARDSMASAAAADGSLLASFNALLSRSPAPTEIAFLPAELVAAAAEAEAESGRLAACTRRDDEDEAAREEPASAPAFALCEDRLAIDRRRHPLLWKEATAAWERERRAFAAESVPPARLGEREPPVPLDVLDAPASRAVALLSGGQSYTAWNERKRRLRLLLSSVEPRASLAPAGVAREAACSACEAEALIAAELRLSELALRSFPKAHEAWAHRRWLLGLHAPAIGAATALGAGAPAAVPTTAVPSAAGPSGLQPPSPARAADGLLLQEVRLCLSALEARHANYHAARHAARAVAKRCAEAGCAVEAARQIVELTRRASERSSGDASVLFVRRTVARALCGTPAEVQCAASGTVEEVAWTREQLERTPWQSALWAHLHALLLELANRARDEPEPPDEVEWTARLLAGRQLGNREQMAVGTVNVERHRAWAHMHAQSKSREG